MAKTELLPVVQQSQDKVDFYKPTITTQELKSVMECMIQDQVTPGKVVNQFAQECASTFVFKQATALSSLHTAYRCALMTLQTDTDEKDSEIILSSFSPTYMLDAILYVKARPQIIDVDKKSFHISTEMLLDGINEKTKTIILSFRYGSFYDYTPLLEQLDEIDPHKKINVIVDISELPSVDALSHLLALPRVSWVVLGFDVNMLVTMGKGAVLLTNNTKLHHKLATLNASSYKIPYRPGYDYQITDYQAAIGLDQINILSLLLERNQKIGNLYMKTLLSSSLQTYFTHPQQDIYTSFPVIDNKSNNLLKRYFQTKHIEIKYLCHHKPLHQLMQLDHKKFINTEKLFATSLLIPIYPYLNKLKINSVTQALQKFL